MLKCFTINQMRKKEEIESFTKLIKDKTYDGVEIFYPYKESLSQQEDYKTSIFKLIEEGKPHDLVLHLPFGKGVSLCLEEEYDNTLKLLKEAIDYAKLFNIKKLTLHLGLMKDPHNREEPLNRVVKALQELAHYCYPQVLMIENMPNKIEFGYSPNEILNIIKLVNQENVKFIYDIGHAHVSEYDELSYLYILKDYLYHTHIHDNPGDRDRHQEIGLGNIDFNAFIKVLKEINYQEFLCMEIIYKDDFDLKRFAKKINDIEVQNE